MGLPAVITGKECTKCGVWKPFDSYYIRNIHPYAYYAHCKPCHRYICRTAHKKYRINNPRTPKQKYLQYLSWVKRKYALSRLQFEQMLCDQCGCCAICNDKLVNRLCVDHCHDTGTVRGLLCDPCNINLVPIAEQAPHALDAVKEYLKLAA